MKHLILFFLLFCVGCRQSKNKGIIAPNKGKYWDIKKDRDISYRKPAYCFYFSSDGDCFFYYYRIDKDTVMRKLFNYGDVIYPNTWKLKSDTLEIQESDYLIKSINEESITLVSTTLSKDTLILEASNYP